MEITELVGAATLAEVVNKMGGQIGVGRYLRDELVLRERATSYRTDDAGRMYIDIERTSESSRTRWQERSARQEIMLCGHAQYVMQYHEDKYCYVIPAGSPPSIVRVGILTNAEFPAPCMTTSEVVQLACQRHWQMPTADIAFLLRECLSNEDIRMLGLQRVIVMHQPLGQSCFVLEENWPTNNRQRRLSIVQPMRDYEHRNDATCIPTGYAFVHA